MMRKSALGAAMVAVAILSGGAYYGVMIYPSQRFRSQLDGEIAKLPSGYTASYKGAAYSLISGDAVITGLTFRGGVLGDPQPQALDLAIDEVDLAKPNLDFGAQWSTAVANPGLVARDTVLPLADRITAKGYDFRLGTMNGHADAWEVTKLRLYPAELLRDGVTTFAQARIALQNAAQPASLDRILPLLKFEAAAMLAVGYDNQMSSNMMVSGTAPATPNSPPTEFSMSIRRISGGYERGVIKTGTAEGMTMDLGKQGSFAVDRLALTDIVLRPLLTRFSSQVVQNVLTVPLLDGLKIGRVEYGGMTMTLPGVATPVPVGTVSLANFEFSHGVPVSGAISWQGFRIEREQMLTPSSRASFEAFGLDAMTLNLAMAYDWDAVGKRLVLHDTVLKVDELGKLDLSMELSGVAPGIRPDVRLAHARLRFEDASLVDRWLRTTAARAHSDPEAVRRQMVTVLPQQAATAAGGNPALGAAAQAFADFLAAPHSLTIEIAPRTPLAPATLMQASAIPPAVLVPLLGLKVTANQ